MTSTSAFSGLSVTLPMSVRNVLGPPLTPGIASTDTLMSTFDPPPTLISIGTPMTAFVKFWFWHAAPAWLGANWVRTT